MLKAVGKGLGMRVYIGLSLALALVAGLFAIVWRQGFAAPAPFLFGMSTAAGEAAYCLAVAERGAELTQGRGEAWLERHLDDQVEFWRLRALGAFGAGRAGLARDSAAPGVNEGAHLHLALQDCAHRAVLFYGHRFELPSQGL